jgi:hypothetical protein
MNGAERSSKAAARAGKGSVPFSAMELPVPAGTEIAGARKQSNALERRSGLGIRLVVERYVSIDLDTASCPGKTTQPEDRSVGAPTSSAK